LLLFVKEVFNVVVAVEVVLIINEKQTNIVAVNSNEMRFNALQ
jgi:hypothetical protein